MNNVPEGVELPKGATTGEHEVAHVIQEYTYAKPKETDKETKHEQDR